MQRSPERKRRRRRAFTVPPNENTTHVYSRKRIGPEGMSFPDNAEREFMFADREKGNFMWALLRFFSSSSPSQVIPSWTGFHIEIQDHVPILKSSVQYLDCIDAPATEMNTIYQV